MAVDRSGFNTAPSRVREGDEPPEQPGPPYEYRHMPHDEHLGTGSGGHRGSACAAGRSGVEGNPTPDADDSSE